MLDLANIMDAAGTWIGLIGGTVGLASTAWNTWERIQAKSLNMQAKITATSEWGAGAADIRIAYEGQEAHTRYSVTAKIIGAAGCEFCDVIWKERYSTPDGIGHEPLPGSIIGRVLNVDISDDLPYTRKAAFLIKGMFEQDIQNISLRVTVRDEGRRKAVAKRTLHISLPDPHY